MDFLNSKRQSRLPKRIYRSKLGLRRPILFWVGLLLFCFSFFLCDSELFARESKSSRKANAESIRKWVILTDLSFRDPAQNKQLQPKIEELLDFIRNRFKNPVQREIFDKESSVYLKNKDIEGLYRWVFSYFLLPTHPDLTPQKARGEKLYKAYCAGCHEPSGSARSKLKFLPQDNLSQISPLMAYNINLLGVPEKNKPKFENVITHPEIWDAIFYMFAKSADQPTKGVLCTEDKTKGLTLETISTSSNVSLLKEVGHNQACLSKIRNEIPFNSETKRN